jgi:hypothetical protein
MFEQPLDGAVKNNINDINVILVKLKYTYIRIYKLLYKDIVYINHSIHR